MDIDDRRLERLGAAISHLYAASLGDEAAWHDMMGSIASVFESPAAHIRISNGGDAPNDQLHALWGYTRDDMIEYARDFAHEDYWSIDGVRLLEPGVPVTGAQLVPPEKLEGTGVYEDFCARFGITDCLALPIARSGDVVSVLCLNGAGDDGFYGAPHLLLARLLQPHLQQAVLTRGRLGGPLDAALGDRLERLGVGMALFDAAGRLAFETPTFGRLAAAAGVFCAGARVPFQEGNPAVCALIAGAVGRGLGGCLAVSAGELGEALVRCAPLPAHPWIAGLVGAPGVMVTLELLGPAREGAADVVAELWGLTPRERELLRVLAAERAIPSTALRLGISRETARTHAKRIYQKAGVHGLAELLTAAAAAPLRAAD